MKRMLSFLLALLMVWSLAVPAMAVEVPTEANTFYLDVDKTSVKVGDTVTLSVYSNTEMTDMMSNSVLIDYDETVFELDKTNSAVTGNKKRWGIIDSTHEDVGKYTGTSMFDVDSEVTIPNGLLATIQFTALAASADTSFEIFLTDASWFNWDDNTKNNIDVKFAGPIDMTVEGNTVQVLLPENPKGYTIETDDATTLEPGSTFTFSVEIAEGYEGIPVVKAGSETLTPNENGSYTITVTESIAIEVSGITRHFEGYGVQMSEDKSITAGEMAEVQIPVLAGEGVIYNAYDLTLTYDADIVNYESCVAANENDKLTVEAEDGTIRIMGYGPDKTVGASPVTLTFSGKAVGDADVELTVARVDIGEHAIGADAPEATISDDGITVIKVSGYTVTLDEGLKADTTLAQNGVDYVFYPTDADNYTYEVTATIGDETFTVGANADGSFTIPGAKITGNIVLTAVMTPKEYDVVINGDDVTGANKATYNTDYTFRVDKKDGYTYSVTVKINNNEYTGVTESNGAYTIPGTAITGPIVITVTKTALPDNQVNVINPGYVSGADTATKGQDYTFRVPEEEGYTYGDVKVTVGGTDISAQVQKNEDGSYTIPGAYVTGTVVIEVPRISGVTVDAVPYITLDEGTVMYLVTASGVSAESFAAKYDGQSMYWSEKYNAFAWLIISADSQENVRLAASEKVSVAEGTNAGTVVYTGDVNGTTVIDINDAQLTYDMYNAKYADFTDVSILKFLCADVNGSTNVNVDDAAAVVAVIP